MWVMGPPHLSVLDTLTVEQGEFRTAGAVDNAEELFSAILHDVTIDEGATLIGTYNMNISGDWTNDGAFKCKKCIVISNGDGDQSLGGETHTIFPRLLILNTGDPDSTAVTASTPVTVTDLLGIDRGQFAPAEGSVFRHIEVTPNGTLAPLGDVAMRGNFGLAPGGHFLPGTHQVLFDSGGTLNLLAPTLDCYDLVVARDTTLDVGQSPITVTAVLTNEGLIREQRAPSGGGSMTFNLTLPRVDVTAPGTLDTLTIERRDQDHPSAWSELKTGMWWTIAPSGTATVTLTLPQDNLLKPTVCRWTDPEWDCAGTGTPVTVSRPGISTTLAGEWRGASTPPSISPSPPMPPRPCP
jgi:hypothetical protein